MGAFRLFSLPTALISLLPLLVSAEQYVCTTTSSVDSSVTTRTFERTKTGFNATFVSVGTDSDGRLVSDVREDVFGGVETEFSTTHLIENQHSILLVKHMFDSADINIIDKKRMKITTSWVIAGEAMGWGESAGKSLNGDYDVGVCHLND